MQADLPHTLFNRKKKGKKGKKDNGLENYKYNPKDKALALQEEANRKARERSRSEGKDVPYTMDELFKK